MLLIYIPNRQLDASDIHTYIQLHTYAYMYIMYIFTLNINKQYNKEDLWV